MSVHQTWLPLGSAQIIDWKHLGRPQSARGATVWVGRVGPEPVVLRTWCSESTTYFEFSFLGHEIVAGTIVVNTSRPETGRLQVKVSVDVESHLSYAETTELNEHSRTGLYGVATRTMEGRVTPDALATMSAGHAEIFEYAPESALGTACGTWIAELLQWVFDTVTQGEDIPLPIADLELEPPPPQHQEPPLGMPPSHAAPPHSAPSHTPDLAPPPADPPPPMRPAAPSLLIAKTTTGDRWEVDAPETYMGRSKQCSIVLKSQRVSRKHASITREDDGFYINDLGAANGIWAGTEKVEREKIENGSEYIIGDVLVSFSYA